MRSPAEMGWSDYIAKGIESEGLVREFELYCGRPQPEIPHPLDWENEEHWALIEAHRAWLCEFRNWLTDAWGGNFAPEWLRAERRAN
jgi:hypothetical protein